MELCQLIYRDRVWTKDFLQSVLIPIEKKKNSVRCEDFRPISGTGVHGGGTFTCIKGGVEDLG